MATFSIAWTGAWASLDVPLRDALVRVGLTDPVIMAAAFDVEVDSDGAILEPKLHLALGQFLDQIGLDDAASRVNRILQLENLLYASEGPAAIHAKRIASISDIELSSDLLAVEQRMQRKRRIEALAVAQVEAVASLPTQWRGKAYRRKEVALNPAAREEAEDLEQARWSKEVLGLLLEAGDSLPFAESVKKARGGITGASVLRCCRGLRANTLKQRVSDWRPFRRWLVAEGHAPFPLEARQVLDYLDISWEGSAPRTFYKNFLTALTFFETAGERVEAERLSSDPAIINAISELATRRALLMTQAEREEPTGTKLAPPLLLAQLAALERRVTDTAAPVYSRLYAWIKLLRHWTSMRWDDTSGVVPSELHMRARGLAGRLVRSKTSGRDKKVKILPLYVAKGAHLVTPWLEAGLALLQEGPLAYSRDYLVPLPTEDLSGTCGLRAVYADAVGLSRALLSSLRQLDSEEALIAPIAARFWTEHSDRTGCTGWCASLGVSTERRGFLGRWAVTASADTYVRTAFREVENLQLLAAQAGRLSLHGGPDFFGEEVILEQLGEFLRSSGVAPSAVDAQLLALTSADATRPIPANPLSALLTDIDQVLEPAAPVEEKDGIPTPTGDDIIDEEDVEGGTGAPVVAEDILLAASERASAEQESAPEGFIIQITQRKVRRLHFVGCCAKIPGEHYKVFECYGTMLPNEHDFDCICTTCFKGGAFELGVASLGPGQAPREEEPSSSSSSASTSSSDAEGTEEPVVRRKRPR